MKRTALFLLILIGLTGSSALGAESPVSISVQTDQPGPKISPTMWGIFFEDMNFGADGGLYAELVKNRSFEFPDPLMGWRPIPRNAAAGSLAILDRDPAQAANPHYLHLST